VTTRRRGFLRVQQSRESGLTLVQMPDLTWGRVRTGWDPWNTLRRISFLWGGRFDLIHAFDCRPAVILPALALRARSGAALFIDWADWWGRGGRIHDRSGWFVRTTFGPIETWFEEAFRLQALGTTVISSALAERCERMGIDRGQILHVSDGCKHGAPPLSRESARAQLGIGGPLIAYLGTCTPAEMELACAMLRRLRSGGSQARLVFVGDPRVPVPRDVEACGAVLRTGFLPADEMALWLGAADLCLIVMPDTIGHRGRWPGKISEYLSAGRPVLMTAVGDAAALVQRVGAGWTAPPMAEALAEAAARVLPDEEALARAGAAARALAEGDLSWDRLAGELESFYHERLASRA